MDPDRCCGYFPTLKGFPGIDSDLPAWRAFRDCVPLLEVCGNKYEFCFIRLSLIRQSVDPVFHLDSDAATALSGDVTTLRQRRVVRLLLNFSSQSERALHFWTSTHTVSTSCRTDHTFERLVHADSLSEHAP